MEKIIDKSRAINEKILVIFTKDFASTEEKKEIYKEILNIYISNKNNEFTKNTDLWFYNILETLGILEKGQENENWNDFNEEQKSVFKKWFFTKEIDRLFSVEVNDSERTDFWKKYVNYMTNIKFYPELSQAIIIELDRHSVIEFGKKGNAAYVYPKEVVTIEKVDNYQKVYSKTNLVYRLKNQPGAIYPGSFATKAGWGHSGGWQEKFKFNLLKLNYE